MTRLSGDRYVDGLLIEGYDYDLQVWVRQGRILAVGLHAARFAGLPWLEARLQAFGEAEHDETGARVRTGRLRETLEVRCRTS